MNKEEIKAVLAIIKRQSFIGATRKAIENNLEYRLLCSAATKLERMLLDIEPGYNNWSRLGTHRKEQEMNNDLETIILCALRYAFTRRSYMPFLVADYIADHFQEISDGRKTLIMEDIRDHIIEAKRFGTYHECDTYILRYWERTLAKLENLKTNNS